MPATLDLNHRKQLGTLAELWECVKPHLGRLSVIVLSVDQLVGLAELHGVGLEEGLRGAGGAGGAGGVQPEEKSGAGAAENISAAAAANSRAAGSQLLLADDEVYLKTIRQLQDIWYSGAADAAGSDADASGVQNQWACVALCLKSRDPDTGVQVRTVRLSQLFALNYCLPSTVCLPQPNTEGL